MIFNFLPKTKLQRLIGEGTLERLENIIPVLKGDGEDVNEIYRKETLVKIFSSFSTENLLANREFLGELLNTAPEDTIDAICVEAGIKVKGRSFNEKVAYILSKGWKDYDFCKAFLKVAELPNSFLPLTHVRFTSEEFCNRPARPFKSLKNYQFSVYEAAAELIVIPNSRFILQMPTGSGKTRTAMELIAQVFNDLPAGKIVFWLAHSEELCEQAVECFKDVWDHIGNKDIKIYKVWEGGKLPLTIDESSFIVGGFQKLYSLIGKNSSIIHEIKNTIELLVIDEAHKALAPTYQKVIKELIGDRSKVIGLTATPGRAMDDFEENRALSDFFFNKVITIKTPKDESVIEYLRGKGVLSQAIFEPLITNINYALDDKQRSHISKFYDFPESLLKTIASDDVRNIEIVKRIEREYQNGSPRLIFFACSVEQSKFICSLLVYLGFRVAHIDGSTDKNTRQKIIEDFKNETLQIVCNFGVLSTGFDAPKTDVVFIARPTRSIVLYSQMIGRGLRGPIIGGTPTCKIITVKDNIHGLPDENEIFDYFSEYFEN